jgi:hypothetical protein
MNLDCMPPSATHFRLMRIINGAATEECLRYIQSDEGLILGSCYPVKAIHLVSDDNIIKSWGPGHYILIWYRLEKHRLEQLSASSPQVVPQFEGVLLPVLPVPKFAMN